NGSRSGSNDVGKDIAELTRLDNVLKDTSTRFWDLCGVGDCLLLGALFQRRMDATTRIQIEREYFEASRRGASPREPASLGDQIAFCEDMAKKLLGPAGDTLAAELAQLRKAVVG